MNRKDKVLALSLMVNVILITGMVLEWFSFGDNPVTMNMHLGVSDIKVTSDVAHAKIPVKVTLYQPVEGQCDDSPFITADNSKITDDSYYKWCAVSRDLMYRYVNFGDTILLQTDAGVEIKLVVKDNMNARWSNRVDMLVPQGSMSSIVNEITHPFIVDNANCKIIKIIRK